MAIAEIEAHRKPARGENLPPESRPESKRYLALDAYRGFIMLILASEGFGLLDAAPQRLNAKDTPVPVHPDLWAVHRPTARTIAAAARNLLRS